MWFASPIWLLGLIPWAGVTLWLLWGRFQRTKVPYLELWRGAIEERPKRAGVRKPPLPLLLAIVATLFAILASAGPSLWGPGSSGTPLQVVLDCGMTMSRSTSGTLRFRAAAARLADELISRSPGIPVHLLVEPGNIEKFTDADDLVKTVNSLPPTAQHTSGLQNEAVRQALRSGQDTIFVVSDQPIQLSDPRIVQIAPDGAVNDLGISLISARETPTPQVMVRVLNQSDQTTTTLDVTTGGQRLRQSIDLPPRGSARDYFFSPRELGETVEAALTAADDPATDDRAWLVRSSRWPAIEARIALDPSVERMAAVYAKRRPPTAGAPTVQIVGEDADLPTAQRGVVIPRSFADAATGAPLEVTDQTITRGINWGALPLLPATTEPPAGWEPLVRSGARTILAAQADPVRKVWIGFATDQWSTDSQFVIFWTNVFDWIGQTGRQFSSSPLEERTDDWQPLSGPAGFPGVYRREDGVQRAFNSLAETLPPAMASTSDWRGRLNATAARHTGRDVSAATALAAILCLLLAISSWRKRPAEVPGEHFGEIATGKN